MTPQPKSPQILALKVPVGDLRRSVDFYVEILGLRLVTSLGEPVFDGDVEYTQALLNASGSPADPFIGLTRRRGVEPDRALTGHVWFGVRVPELGAALSRLARLGHPVSEGPVGGPTLRIVQLHDLDGYGLELFEAPRWPEI